MHIVIQLRLNDAMKDCKKCDIFNKFMICPLYRIGHTGGGQSVRGINISKYYIILSLYERRTWKRLADWRKTWNARARLERRVSVCKYWRLRVPNSLQISALIIFDPIRFFNPTGGHFKSSPEEIHGASSNRLPDRSNYDMKFMTNLYIVRRPVHP